MYIVAAEDAGIGLGSVTQTAELVADEAVAEPAKDSIQA
jgi:hypothetical protein